MAGSTGHIIQSLLLNLAIAAAKGVAAVITRSGAMLAETIHSAADCGNQALLLFGVKQTQRAPDASHPLGYGRSLYFWSFMVALLLFTGGGVFSIYEGVHKLQHPEPVESVLVAVVILLFSIALEGYATFSNIREANKRRGSKPFFAYLRQTKDSDFIVVMGENSAATVGLVLALGAVLLAKYTHDPRWDAMGSIAIGVVLVVVAVFLAVEVKSLLVGEAADEDVAKAVAEVVAEHAAVESFHRLITVQQGPGEVMVAMKIRVAADLSCGRVSELINEVERKLREKRPEVRWCFIEPDLTTEASAAAPQASR